MKYRSTSYCQPSTRTPGSSSATCAVTVFRFVLMLWLFRSDDEKHRRANEPSSTWLTDNAVMRRFATIK